MSAKPDHRMKLIRTAAKLFQQQGYSATGVNQIIKDSETPRGSFYYYFPKGKEELAAETVRNAGKDISLILENAFKTASSFPIGVDNITNKIGDWFEKTGFTAGCPITAIHLEKTPENSILTQVCQDVFSSWVHIVERFAVSNGHESQAHELGEAVILGLEGAWILARAQQNKGPFTVVGKMIKSMLR